MSRRDRVSARAITLALGVTGTLIVLASFGEWAYCPTTPCGGPFLAVSEYSGLDLGFGVVTALAGLVLAFTGFHGFRHNGVSSYLPTAPLHSVAVVLTIGAAVVWMFVIPGDDKDYGWPPYGAMIVGILGVFALATTVLLQRAASRE